jgi:general secretion pathway protein I
MNSRSGSPSSRGRLGSAQRQVGFTLIEIVVAFVLLALVLSTSFELFSAGLRRAGDLEDQSRAILIAQSKIAATGMEQPLAEGVAQGDSEDGRFHWTVTVAPSSEGDPPPDQPQPGPGTFRLYRVDVRVEWAGADQRAHSYALATLGFGTRT